MKTRIWIESGENSKWLAEAIAGAFASSIVLNCDELGKECLEKLLPQIDGQKVALIAIDEHPLAMRKKWDGIVLLPYGSRVKTAMNGVIVHIDRGRRNERDIIVETMLTFLRKEKILVTG